MVCGTPSCAITKLTALKALDTLFNLILAQLAESDIFGESESPSIFVVYAHDNEREGTANAQCVVRIIAWLKAIRSRTISDKAPLPLWESRIGGLDSIRNILSNQFCLLPDNTSGNVGTIHRVEKVVVCGSEVLKRYYHDDFTSSYLDAIVKTYVEGKEQSFDSDTLEANIRSIVETQCQHDAFHHVLTELAFLILRSRYRKDNHGIIPLTLGEDLMEWLPFRENCDLVLKLKSLNNADLHQLFFKLLGQLYIQDHILINKYKECYDHASERLRNALDLSEDRTQQIVGQEIAKIQRAISAVQNAALRSRRRDMHRMNASALHHSTNKSLQDLGSKINYLYDESRTKLSLERLQDVLEWLSTCPFQLHHASVSSELMPQSGEWIANRIEYQNWLHSESSSLMMVHGIRGCGKSSMFSVIIDQLLSTRQSDERGVAVAYYYCSDTLSSPERTSPDAILRCILRQLSIDPESNMIEPRILTEYQRLAGSPATRASLMRLGRNLCVELIQELTSNKNNTYIALDAIDELPEDGRAELIDALKHIVSGSAGVVKIFVTSRNDAQIQGLLQSAIMIGVSPAENKSDIQRFVENRLKMLVHSRQLLNGNVSERLFERIRTFLISGAQEM
jgi:hypothetical protein